MIKIFCNYCDAELRAQQGGNLTHVKTSIDSDGKLRPVRFDEHLCDDCLAVVLKALEKRPNDIKHIQ